MLTLDTKNRQSHELFRTIEKYGLHCTIAGGAVRAYLTNQPITTDYDLFFDNEDHFNEVTKDLRVVYNNEMMSVFKPDGLHIQAMKIYLPIEELLDSFDFTICQFALRDGIIHTTQEALLDLGRKALVPHKITYPIASYRRSVKYQGYGFKMCKGSVTDFLEQISNTNLYTDTVYID